MCAHTPDDLSQFNVDGANYNGYNARWSGGSERRYFADMRHEEQAIRQSGTRHNEGIN